MTLVQWIGLRLSSVVLQLSSSATALTLIVLAGACLFHRGTRRFGFAHPLPTAPAGALAIFAALIVAFRAVIVTYDGWYEAIYFAEEDKNPTRNLPTAMIGGVVLIVALYLLMNVAFLLVMPMAELAASKLPAADAAQIVFASSLICGALAAKFVTLLSLLTLISLVNSVMLGAPRILFAVGRDGLFTERVTAVSATGTPRPALLLSSLAAAVLVASGTFENIVTIAAFFVASIYCLNYIAVFTLRQREPATAAPLSRLGISVEHRHRSAGLVSLSGGGNSWRPAYRIASVCASGHQRSCVSLDEEEGTASRAQPKEENDCSDTPLSALQARTLPTV